MSETEASEGRDPVTGRFLPSNRFWEARSSAGANPKFETAEALWRSCVEYFDWNEANPLWEAKAFAYQGSVTQEPVAKMRAMTIAGLCQFLDVTLETWGVWRKTRADLSDVVTRAESVISRQKFEGAAADLLNPNIIARDLGLADKSEIQAEVKARVSAEPLSDDEWASKHAPR